MNNLFVGNFILDETSFLRPSQRLAVTLIMSSRGLSLCRALLKNKIYFVLNVVNDVCRSKAICLL